MIGAGTAMFVLALTGLWLRRRGRLLSSRRWLSLAVAGAALPFVANSAGWVFTEMGRQPWIVQGLFRTDQGVSPTVGTGEVLTTLIGFTLLYGVLAGVAGWLFVKLVKAGPKEDVPEVEGEPDLTLAY